MQKIFTFVDKWAETKMDEVEREIKTRSRKTIPSKNTLRALEVHNLIAGAIGKLKLFPALPQNEELISYRAGDTWKYQFAAPLLISRGAAKWLWDGRSGREKAVDVFEGFTGNAQMVAIYGEHIWPTASMRTHLPRELLNSDERGSRRHVVERFPNTHYAFEVLRNNIIDCQLATEAIGVGEYTGGGGRHRCNPESTVVARRWFVGKDGETLEGRPEHLDRIACRIKQSYRPSSFDDFWSLLTEEI